MLRLLGIDVILIAEHNQYAGREGVGASIHIQCVYVLAVLFAAITLLLSFGLRLVGRNWYRYSLDTAIVWTVLASIFFLCSDRIGMSIAPIRLFCPPELTFFTLQP